MGVTKDYLMNLGIVIIGDDAAYTLPVRQQIITNSIEFLIKSDFATQNLLGQYLDSRFELLHTKFNPLEFRDQATQDSLKMQTMGWILGRKIRIDPSRIDEVCASVALSCTLGSAPSGPGDVTMNGFRIYDVLRLLQGDDFESEGNYELTDADDPTIQWLRYRYFSFMSRQLKGIVKNQSFESILASLFTMPTYQLIPCLVTAFRLYEKGKNLFNMTLAYPVLEPRDWSDLALTELLEHTKVEETPEWVKIVPMMPDESSVLKGLMGTASMPFPHFDESLNDDEPQELSFMMRRYISIVTSCNFAIYDTYEEGKTDWLTILTNSGVLNDQLGYLASFHTSVKGYYLADVNLPEEHKLIAIYKDLLIPFFRAGVRDSFKRASNLWLSTSVNERISDVILDGLDGVIGTSIPDTFAPILDYTSRRIMMASIIRKDENKIPMFYSFSSSGGIHYTKN